jgi:hypothetical protein
MRVTRIYTGKDMRSHFDDFELPFANMGNYARFCDPILVKHASFRETPPEGFYDLHHAPGRQLAITLRGRVELTCGGGESRILGPGDILLAEDVTGEGHTSRELDGVRNSLFLPLLAEAVIPGLDQR